MSLSTYGELKTAVVAWSFTGGGVTEALVASDFMPQVQSMMYMGDGLDIQPLRIAAMIDSATVTPATGGIITLSSQISTTLLDFIELTPTQAGSLSLNYVPPWQFRKQQDALQSTVGPPTMYTMEGDSLYLAPAAVTPIAAKWYEKFTALSGSSDTDWVLTNAPQIYLNGCLMLACAYAQDDREGQFRAKFAASIRAINLDDAGTRRSGSVPVARPRSVA